MATPDDVAKCADIERHLKALLMPGSSPTTSHTPPKRSGGQPNKKYEEDFPALAPGMSHPSFPQDLRDVKSPPKGATPPRSFPQHYNNTPPRRNDFRPQRYNRDGYNRDGYRDSRQMNGFDYFKGKEIANVKPNRETNRVNQNKDFVRSPRNVEIAATIQNQVIKTGKEPQEPREPFLPKYIPLTENATQDATQDESNLKPKKKAKKREKRETNRPDSSNSLLNKLAVNRASGSQAFVESPHGPPMERRDSKKIKNKPEKLRNSESDNPHERLRNEIMRERQRTIEMERRSYEQDLQYRLSHLNREILNDLESEFLYPLKKPSNRFPDALFLCQLCNYHCNMDNFNKHIKQQNHVSSREMRRAETLLLHLPYPAESQCSVITKLLERLHEEHGLSADDLRQRQQLVERLNSILQAKGLTDCKLQLYGSSLSGFGTKESNLNLDLIFPSMDVLPVLLLKLHQILNEEDDLTDVSTDYDAKMPKIFFKDSRSGLNCDITWSNIGTVQTSRLLARYRSLDPRVAILGVAFKLWAQMCRIDCQERGTLPPHCFAVMLVYFLQQHRPAVLPVLQEEDQMTASSKTKIFTAVKVEPNMDPINPPNEGKLTGKWKCRNNQSVGELWIELLRFYGVTFKSAEHVVCIRFKKRVTRAEKKWDGKVTAIEDPYCRKRNLSRSIPNQVVFRFILERLREAYKYFGIPQLISKRGPLFESLDPEVLKKSRKGRTLLESSPESSEISGPEDEGESTPHDGRKLPGTLKGAAKRENDEKEPDFDVHDTSSSDDDMLDDLDPDLNLDDLSIISRLDLGGDSNDERKMRTDSESSDLAALVDASIPKSMSSAEASEKTEAKSPEKSTKRRPDTPPCQFIINLMSSFSESDLNYVFDKDKLSGGKSPPLYCGMCGSEGHWKDDCPTQILPELVDLSPLSPSYLKQMDAACQQVMCDKAPSKRETEDRLILLTELEDHIKVFYPDASLELFGSSCNGFVFTGSDMDICLTFADKTGESFDHAEVIDRLANHLRTNKCLHNILPITTAKVPIVKFNHRKHNVECDISLYNTLAQHNTRMLRAYCMIDERVQVLGYTMKHFAKLCDIRDASRGSLSSYAYILMVLYFLQQRNPPVIPVLQELYDKNEPAPVVTVDGWNAWFFDDISKLTQMWPEQGQNKESVGELWVGLLRFYTEEFNFKEHVICIRQKALLTHFEKFWNAKMICIEDPFDLNHNLGVGVSRKMSIYIRKALIRGRELFGTPYETASRHTKLNNFLFDSRKLMVEAPPNDRGCRACGKIGHKVKDCPNKRNHRQQQQQQQQMQRRQDQNQHQQMLQQSMHERHERSDNNHKEQENHRGNGADAFPKSPRQAFYFDTIQRHLHTNQPPMGQNRQYAQQQQNQQQHRGSYQTGPTSNKRVQNSQHPPHFQQHQQGSPNQSRGGSGSFDESNSLDRSPIGGPPTLPTGIHPLNRMSRPLPTPANWSPNALLPSVRFNKPRPVLQQSPTDRPPAMENTNATQSMQQQPISPPQHPIAYFPNQGYPISFMPSASTMGTPPSMHMFPQTSAPNNSKQPGRDEPPVMICRPPAPPPFPHPVWMVNAQSYPFGGNLNPNSPIRPNMTGSQMVSPPQALLGTSPQTLLGTSPQRGNFMPPAQFQHMPMLPEQSANNNNRTLPE